MSKFSELQMSPCVAAASWVIAIPLAIWLGCITGDKIRGEDSNIYTDKQTGCQYLIARGASKIMTPRMDGEKQVGCFISK